MPPGEVAEEEWKDGQWKGSVEGFAQWRGKELADITAPRPRRRRMRDYHISKPEKYTSAAMSAWFLARRAVALKRSGPGYKYYLVAHAIARKPLPQADEEWIARFVGNPRNAPLVAKQQVQVISSSRPAAEDPP